MDYPVKTLNQLRPILQGFRKAAGLTQATVAAQLGVTQQTYAQLEANPATVSMERLFKVMRVLGVDLTLTRSEIHRTKTATPKPLAAKATAKRPARKKPAPANKAAREAAKEAASKAATISATKREDW